MGVLAIDKGELNIRLLLFVVLVVAVVAVLIVGTLLSGRHERPETTSQTALRRPAVSTASWPDPAQVRQRQEVVPLSGPPAYDRSPPRVDLVSGDARPRFDGRSAELPLPTFSRPVPLPSGPQPDVRPPDFATHSVRGGRGVGPCAVRRIVQCPRCGDFDVAMREKDDTIVFTCRIAGHAWTWRRGNPWPATVVRPTARPQRPVHDTGTA